LLRSPLALAFCDATYFSFKQLQSYIGMNVIARARHIFVRARTKQYDLRGF
jgi:hypothetical protein